MTSLVWTLPMSFADHYCMLYKMMLLLFIVIFSEYYTCTLCIKARLFLYLYQNELFYISTMDSFIKMFIIILCFACYYTLVRRLDTTLIVVLSILMFLAHKKIHLNERLSVQHYNLIKKLENWNKVWIILIKVKYIHSIIQSYKHDGCGD